MKTVIAAALVAIIASPVLAHGSTKPQHGGIVAVNGETLFELVAKPAGTQLFVVDEDEPVKAAGMTATLTTSAGGAARNIALKAAVGNRFDGPALALKPGEKVAVMVIDTATKAHLGGTLVVK